MRVSMGRKLLHVQIGRHQRNILIGPRLGEPHLAHLGTELLNENEPTRERSLELAIQINLVCGSNYCLLAEDTAVIDAGACSINNLSQASLLSFLVLLTPRSEYRTYH